MKETTNEQMNGEDINGCVCLTDIITRLGSSESKSLESRRVEGR